MRDRPLCAIALLFVSLVFLVTFQEGIPGSPLPQRNVLLADKEEVTVTGDIYNREEKNEKHIYYLKHLSWKDKEQLPEDLKIAVIMSDDTICPIGSTVTIQGTVYQLQISRNKGQFNSALYDRIRNIDYRVSGKRLERILVKKSAGEYIYQLRQQFKQNIYYYLPETEAGIMTAMLWGDKSGLKEEVKELYKMGGILHILSISGLHISLIGMAVYTLFRKCIGRYVPSAFGGLVVLFFYGMITGFGVSTLRAFIMFGVMLGAEMTGRTYDMCSAISLAAILILIKQPLYLYHSGFQLSFGAVIALAVLQPALQKIINSKHKFLNTLTGSLSIQLATLPILLTTYYSYPLYSILINVCILPFVSFLAALGMFLSLFGGIVWLDTAVAWGIMGILKLNELVCRVFAALPGANVKLKMPGEWNVLLYYAGLLLFCSLPYLLEKIKSDERLADKIRKHQLKKTQEFLLKRRGQLKKIGSILLLCTLPCILCLEKKEDIKITMVDVGQGDCFVIQTKKQVFLIDGGSTDVEHVGKYRIESFLKAQGIWHVDFAIVSHTDADHMNGLLELLEEGDITFEYLIMPKVTPDDKNGKKLIAAANNKNVKILYGKKDMALQMVDGSFTCLYPDDLQIADKNESSLIWRFESGNFSMLFTGDGGKEAEERLLKEQNSRLKATVLKVGHHGSKTASSEEFIKIVAPDAALISSGIHNSYGHPAQETLETLHKFHTQIYHTQEMGAVELCVRGEKLHVEKFCK